MYRAQGIPKRFDIGQAPTSLAEIIPNVLLRSSRNVSRFTDRQTIK